MNIDMGERRHLFVPQVVAARRSLDETVHTNDTSVFSHSRHSSQSTASDASSPATPTFSRGHSRHTSSTSSVTYIPPLHHELLDSSSIIRKPVQPLPDVAEEPVDQTELEGLPDASHSNHASNSFEEHYRWSADFQGSHIHSMPTPPAEDVSYMDFFDARDLDHEHMAKRRKSGSLNAFARGIVSRMPSFSRSLRDRKRASWTSAGRGEANSSPVSPSRASSRASSHRGTVGNPSLDISNSQISSTIETIVEDVNPTEQFGEPEEPKEEPRISTPLLHPLMMEIADAAPDYQSPLQSPSIASPTALSTPNTPISTPQVRQAPSPPLSTKPSVASFKRVRNSGLVPQSEIPPMLISDSTDEWADKLGHANFTVDPEPYLPEVCDVAACHQLMADWHRARSEFAKHLARTSTHFGPTSQTYTLTQEKWAEIDAMWKRYNDLAVAKLGQSGHSPDINIPSEPAPVAVIPMLEAVRGEGKFPQLGDGDIVGPMHQGASMLKRRPTKRDRFFMAMGSFQSPMRVLKQSFTAKE